MEAMSRSHQSRGRAALYVLLSVCALVIVGLLMIELSDDSNDSSQSTRGTALSLHVADDPGQLDVGAVNASRTGSPITAASADAREALETANLAAEQVPDPHAVFGVLLGRDRGMPIADAQITISGAEGDRETITDDEGRFHSGWPTASAPRLKIRAAGFVDLYRAEVEVDRALELRMAPAASLEVIAGGTARAGDPNGSARLIDLRLGRTGRNNPREVDFDAQGSARFTDLAPGEYFAYAQAAGTGMAFERVTIAESETRVLQLALPLAVQLSGRVLEADREVGIADVELRLRPSLQGVWREVEQWAEQRVRTDADGRYRFDHVQVGTGGVELRAPWGDRTRRSIDLSGATGPQEWDFRLDGPAAISGVVRDARGRPVENALVQLHVDRAPERLSDPIERDSWDRRTQRSDAQGAFLFADVPAGPTLYVCAAWRADADYGFSRYAEAVSGVQNTKLKAGESRADLVIALEPTGSLKGVVRDAEGNGLSDVSVELFHSGSGRRKRWDSTSTSDTGAFDLGGLLPGDYTVVALHVDFEAGAAEFESISGSTEELLFELERESVLDVVVRDESGNGLQYARVSASRAGVELEDSEKPRRVTSDRYGRALFTGLPEGLWRITASLRDYDSPSNPPVLELPTDQRVELTLRARPIPERATIVGTATMEHGGVPRRLRFLDPRGGSLEVVDGRFKLTGARPGRARLMLTAEDCVSVRFDDLTLIPGGELDLGSVELEPASRVHVVAIGPDDKRLDEFEARLIPLSTAEGGAGTAAKPLSGKDMNRGRVRFSGVPRRTWRLRVTAEGYVTHRAEVVVDELDVHVEVAMQKK